MDVNDQLVPGKARVLLELYDAEKRSYQTIGKAVSGITVKSKAEVERLFAEVEEAIEDRRWRDKKAKH